MRKVLFFLCIICISTIADAQVVYPYRDIKLEKPADYTATESMALSAATFLLTAPFSAVDVNRSGALEFLSNWMFGNKKYSFYMAGKATELNTDNNILSLFAAAMAKYTLENKAEAVNPLVVDQHAAMLVIAYCDDPKHNFKLKSKYRKILEKN
jgi:hypothetical protein